MGGNAFRSGPNPLSTPRMPENVYLELREHYQKLLRGFYASVATPLEAPAKTSYGDIDILVSKPLAEPPTKGNLEKHLKAVRSSNNDNSPTTSFAVPYFELAEHYVQIDVHLCSDDTFHWQSFHQAHGDLWNLLGTAIRPLGLTANDKGLHLRIAEIEPLNKKKSLLLLTQDPRKVIEYLGLDIHEYEKRFRSIEALYEYATSCRFFDAGSFRRDNLKSGDRKRMLQRETYRIFVEAWIPDHFLPWVEKKEELLPTREDVTAEALEAFEKCEEHQAILKHWRAERNDLLSRQERRAERKRDAAARHVGYADSWIDWLTSNDSKSHALLS